ALHPWHELARELDGRGVPDLEEALLERTLRPVFAAFRALTEPDLVRRAMAAAGHGSTAGREAVPAGTGARPPRAGSSSGGTRASRPATAPTGSTAGSRAGAPAVAGGASPDPAA